MTSITRTDFKRAIENGIRVAGDLLSDLDRENLRNIGAVAKSFGTNYPTGCPAVMAGFVEAGTDSYLLAADDRYPVSQKAACFAKGFDDVWVHALSIEEFQRHDERIQVTD